MSDSERGPVIDLEPKNPFRWSVFLSLVALWAVFVGVAVYLKSGMLRMIWPAILFLLVVYLGVCTVVVLRRRK